MTSVTKLDQRTRIKICGVTEPDLACYAIAAGADAVGLVFVGGSPRVIDIDRARDIAAALPVGATSVALFVNPSVDLVQRVVSEVAPTLLQFHGDESAAFCEQFAHPYWKAVRVSAGADLLELKQRFCGAQRLLLDADAIVNASGDATRVYGGTGESFDWRLIPATLANPIVLSGGLTPDNVADAVRSVRPWAVDVSSGVEQQRGIKSRERIQRFIHEVQQEDARPHAS